MNIGDLTHYSSETAKADGSALFNLSARPLY